ncbi:ROK family transcriptional regulator [Pontibacter sp. FD36]|uniref:ROK family transcriptional regulator n=1 Tax=Pontibacter sp. FD36 TaxID=2789860 RepID=UPI0018AC66C9|nr:ROK family transcriptional regulator [Pontibacter sp. FD36]MBF8963638.1 ROK family transcriptional regulator [Pontibacter sp. FD36]
MSAFLALEEGYLEKLNHVERKKHLQKIRIVRHLYVKGARSNADICNRFNISSPTSMALLNELMAEGLVEKQGRGESVGGRKPELYGLRNNSLFVLSIEMEKFSTRMAIFDGNNNNITGVHTFPLNLSKDLSAIEELYQHANSLVLSAGIDTDKLMGIGLSMPGLVSSREGDSYTYLLTGQNETPLQDLLALKFSKPVYIQNDVKSITLAEYRFGAAQSKRDVLVLTLDWGIGLGIIMDGKLRVGTSGFAGEFGHIPFIDNGVLCHCGKRGCLETVASGSALARMAREGLQAGQDTLLKALSDHEPEKIEPQAIIQAAHEGDQYAINILAETGRNLGKGIAMLIQLFNPELIIIGGKMAEARQYLTTPIQQSINTYCMTQLRERTEIALSKLGQKAGILGPVATVMERIFEHRIESTK